MRVAMRVVLGPVSKPEHSVAGGPPAAGDGSKGNEKGPGGGRFVSAPENRRRPGALEEVCPVCFGYSMGSVIDAELIETVAQLAGQRGLAYRKMCRVSLGRVPVGKPGKERWLRFRAKLANASHRSRRSRQPSPRRTRCSHRGAPASPDRRGVCSAWPRANGGGRWQQRGKGSGGC